MKGPDQPFPSSEETMAVFAEHLSAGKVELYRQLGLDLVMGRREGIRFWDAYSDRSFINCHCNGGVFNLGHRNPRRSWPHSDPPSTSSTSATTTWCRDSAPRWRPDFRPPPAIGCRAWSSPRAAAR